MVMAVKRFHTRKQWHNTLVMAWVVLFLLLISAILLASSGRFMLPVVIVMVSGLGLSVALYRDRGHHCRYTLEDGRLVLSDKAGSLSITADQISDASLIDRAGAREYIRAKVEREHPNGGSGARRQVKRILRFCSVDIGVRSFTLGMGRRVIDRMPQAKNDLVLLRLRNGDDHLLSPQYNQDLVDSISRMVRHAN